MNDYCHRAVVKNAVEAVNELHKYIRLIVPKYQEYLSKGFKINATGTFSRKDSENLEIIKKDNPVSKRIRSYFKISQHSIYICFDTNYQIAESACRYFECAVYLWDYKASVSIDDPKDHWEIIEFHPDVYATNYNVEEILQTEDVVKTLERQKMSLENEISRHKHKYRAFF